MQPTKKNAQKNPHLDIIEIGISFGGERGIRTPVTVFAVNMISNHAPSTTRTPLHDALVLSHGINLVTDTRILYRLPVFLSSFFSENVGNFFSGLLVSNRRHEEESGFGAR